MHDIGYDLSMRLKRAMHFETIQTLCQRGFGEWQCNTNKFDLEPRSIQDEPRTQICLA
jgi:hypothetical protein